VEAAAARFVPDVTWRAGSVVKGDFSCRGRVEQAILGTNPADIVIAIFLHGTTKPPEILRYSAKARRAESAELKIESLDFTPQELKEIADSIGGEIPPGLRASKTCKGLNLSDGDSAHIYWNHKARRFDDWSL